MKIAFISYEYPPDRAIGGIATYVHQAAKMLRLRGHHVEVFTSSPVRTTTQLEEGVIVHRLQEGNRTFVQDIGQLFTERHNSISFDVLEGSEFGAWAREAVKLVPDIPLVVKLHTPRFLVEKINYIEPSFQLKARRFLGALRRLQKPEPFSGLNYNPNHDIERFHALEADEIATPSQDLGIQLAKAWGLPTEKIFHVPYPYMPSQALLNIPIDTHHNVVTFLGRLEIRKGILYLGQAIPVILRQHPNTIFRFVGSPLPSPQLGLNMQQYLQKKLRAYSKLLEFTGSVTLDHIPSILATTDICIFPSLWENFPNVCLEAMAAGRGVIGSSAGGMTEMLNLGQSGKLVPPCSPEKIAEAVIELLTNPALRMRLGQAARERVLAEYSLERIGTLQEASYVRAIERRRALGARTYHDSVSEMAA